MLVDFGRHGKFQRSWATNHVLAYNRRSLRQGWSTWCILTFDRKRAVQGAKLANENRGGVTHMHIMPGFDCDEVFVSITHELLSVNMFTPLIPQVVSQLRK